MGIEREAPGRPTTDDYTAALTVAAPSARVFSAIATPDGLTSWWTPIVAGSLAPGTRFELGFPDSDTTIALRVERARPAALVEWTCLGHSAQPEWQGTILEFRLTERAHGATDVAFRHAGLARELGCYGSSEREWDRVLGALRAAIETDDSAPPTVASAAA